MQQTRLPQFQPTGAAFSSWLHGFGHPVLGGARR